MKGCRNINENVNIFKFEDKRNILKRNTRN